MLDDVYAVRLPGSTATILAVALVVLLPFPLAANQALRSGLSPSGFDTNAGTWRLDE